MKNETVLFLCTYNSVRSPIAEGLLKSRGNGRYTVWSAGIAPIRVNPYAVKAMLDIGIDISGHMPLSVFGLQDRHFTYIVTFSDNACYRAGEHLPGCEKLFHRTLESPPEIGKTPAEVMAEFSQLRDTLNRYLDEIFLGLPPLKVSDGKKQDLKDQTENAPPKYYQHSAGKA